MKKLELWIAVVGFLGVLSFAASAQDARNPLVTPTTASVSPGERQRLVAGEIFSFQLQFHPAPDGYGGGQIRYHFRLMESGSSTGRGPGRDEPFFQGEIPLQDGLGIYNVSLPINDYMPPGKWKLVDVYVGRRVQKEVPIEGNVTFEIPEFPPLVIHTQAPREVEAGHQFIFRITLNEFPKRLSQRCALMLSAQLRQGPNMTPYPTVKEIEVKPDQLTYEFSAAFDPDNPSGPWQGEVWDYSRPLDGNGPCRYPLLSGDVRFNFTVKPNRGLVTPTSVAVTVNPSQIQLLRAAAERLRVKAQHLKVLLSSENIAANQVILRTGLQEAMADLDATEKTYKEKGVDPSFAPAVNVFFGDIRLDYNAALKTLADDSAHVPQNGLRLEHVNVTLDGRSPRLSSVSEAVLASILHNAKAYDLVASTKLMTFNLDVFSEPKGATISYHQRGEEYQFLDHDTDWRIENLPRAVYFIRLQKPGYEEKEIPFNGVESTSTSIDIPLVPKRGGR